MQTPQVESCRTDLHCSAAACVLLLALTACGDERDAAATQDATAATPSPATENGAPPTPAERADTAAHPEFDIESVPVSDAALGAFPYFALPTGFEHMNRPEVRDFDRFPFWVGDRYEWVEGKSFAAPIEAVSGKSFSQHELRRNIEHVVTQAGGVKVTEGRIPNEAISTLDEDITVDRNAGLGDIWNEPVTTYLIRRADQDIWVHLVTNSAMGSWTIAATEAFQPTATLIPADELKQQLDSAGKAVVQVNFATDEADILPDSQPQLDQISRLLDQDPALQLSVNGHTDNTGGAARNQELSEQRAAAVVAALGADGIDAARLQARGFGASQPVADKGSEEGKARNRRVELVKR